MSTDLLFPALCNEESLRMMKTDVSNPWIMIDVNNTKVKFLVDTGAAITVIKRSELPRGIIISNEYEDSIVASGEVLREPFTRPVKISFCGKQCETKMLVSDQCPWNLLGRDVMCKLGIKIDCDTEGMNVRCAKEPKMTVYEWVWPKGSDLREFAMMVCVNSDFQKVSDMHVTANVTWTTDTEYEGIWAGRQSDEITLTNAYWKEHKCAVQVTLTEEAQSVYRVENAVPHLSLAKGRMDEWKDLGPFVKGCSEATDWTETHDTGIYYSEQCAAYKKH